MESPNEGTLQVYLKGVGSSKCLKALYFAYIAASFDYCSLVWDSCCLTMQFHLPSTASELQVTSF